MNQRKTNAATQCCAGFPACGFTELSSSVFFGPIGTEAIARAVLPLLFAPINSRETI